MVIKTFYAEKYKKKINAVELIGLCCRLEFYKGFACNVSEL